MKRWERAADAQVELAEYFGTDRGQKVADQFFKIHFEREDMQGKAHPLTIRTHAGEEIEMSYGAQVWLNLRVAEPIFISEEMMDLVGHAAPTFQVEPLLVEDLITPSGFVYFPRPMLAYDRNGKSIAHRALSWYPMQTSEDPFPEEGNVNYSGVMFTFYSHVDDDDDYIDEFRESVEKRGGGSWAICHTAIAWFGEKTVPEIDDPLYTQAERDSVLHYWQPLHAMLRLMQQYVSERASYKPARPTRRRAMRAQMPEHDVTVIRLRRPRSKGEPTGKHVEWSHQWLVGGHWRNQYFPSLKANRQIYIAPYIKGPEDKPLRIREKRVFEFVR